MIKDYERPAVRHFEPQWFWQLAVWKLEEDYQAATTLVPAGFVWDGGSVPLPFRTIFSPTGKLFYPSSVHDFALACGVEWRAAADLLRQELLETTTMHPWRVAVVYWGVRAWGPVRGFVRPLKVRFQTFLSGLKSTPKST